MSTEYGSEGIVSTKVDVYSFGVLMIEMVTGKKATNANFSGSFTMKRWISEAIVQDKILEIVDANLLVMTNEDNLSEITSCLNLILKLAVECIEDFPENRINMSTILASLMRINAEFLRKMATTIDRRSRVSFM